MADASTQGPKLKFEGFANAPTNDKGERVDFRKVPAFKDSSAEGKVRRDSQKKKSVIVKHKTEGTGTNGAPAAVVGKTPTQTATGT